MIPAIVADELRATLLDYLDTTFSFQDVAVAEALQRFLTDPKQGIFKGPFLRLQLPFRRGRADEAGKILDIAPPFIPYLHQITAFERLTGKDNHQPQHTLVTTGTGSGKTECFLYPHPRPLLSPARAAGHQGDHPLPDERPGRRPGPPAGEGDLERTSGCKGEVTAGLYVGGEGDAQVMGPDHLITDREVLRKHPPDILLTNYKMLDFLLLRPEDGKLWEDTGPDIRAVHRAGRTAHLRRRPGQRRGLPAPPPAGQAEPQARQLLLRRHQRHPGRRRGHGHRRTDRVRLEAVRRAVSS